MDVDNDVEMVHIVHSMLKAFDSPREVYILMKIRNNGSAYLEL